MDEREIEIGAPVVVGDVVLRPIARRRVANLGDERGQATLARIRPVGVIVEDGDSRALGLDGDPLADEVLEKLGDVGP